MTHSDMTMLVGGMAPVLKDFVAGAIGPLRNGCDTRAAIARDRAAGREFSRRVGSGQELRPEQCGRPFWQSLDRDERHVGDPRRFRPGRSRLGVGR